MSYKARIRAMQRMVANGIAAKVEKAMAKNNGKIPYGLVKKEIDAAKPTFLTLSCDHINYALKRRKNKRISLISSATPATIQTVNPIVVNSSTSSEEPSTALSLNLTSESVKPKGRPKGTTEKQKRSEKLNIVACKNEICKIYQTELKRHKSLQTSNIKPNYFPTGRLDEIIQEVKTRRNIGEDVDIKKQQYEKE